MIFWGHIHYLGSIYRNKREKKKTNLLSGVINTTFLDWKPSGGGKYRNFKGDGRGEKGKASPLYRNFAFFSHSTLETASLCTVDA